MATLALNIVFGPSGPCVPTVTTVIALVSATSTVFTVELSLTVTLDIAIIYLC